MPRLLKNLLSRLHKPAGDDGADTSGTDTAVLEDPGQAGKEDRGDVVDPALNADTLAAVVADAGAGEGEGATTEEPAQRGGRIPKARFDEVIGQREAEKARADALQAQLDALQSKAPAAAPAPTPTPAPAPVASAAAPAVEPGTDLKALRAQARAAAAAGNEAEVARLDDLIDNAVLSIAEARVSQRYEQQQFVSTTKAAAAQASAEFPYLDTPEGADVVDLILLSRDKKIAAGMPPGQALLEATRHIAPKFAPEGEALGRASTEGAHAKDTRTANALARGATDSNLQPPTAQAGIGNRTTEPRVNVEKMTDKQFEDLPEAEKKRLRGD